MLWLASYPRSGNTFFRIILSEIYGLESSEFHDPQAQREDRDYLRYPIVKTHHLPGDLLPQDPSIPAVYLLRDGRDALVSTARHHCMMIDATTPFRRVLRWAIRARRGSFFGGWSRHVRLWRRRAALVLRFEDLVADPLACVERLREIYPLPQPRQRRIPSFEEIRARKYEFGHGAEVMDTANFRERFFRQGKVGGWKTEMPWFHRMLFYLYHGPTLWRLGYR